MRSQEVHRTAHPSRHPSIKALNQWIDIRPGRPQSPSLISGLGNMGRRSRHEDGPQSDGARFLSLSQIDRVCVNFMSRFASARACTAERENTNKLLYWRIRLKKKNTKNCQQIQ